MFKNASDKERADLIKAAGQGQAKRDAEKAGDSAEPKAGGQ